MTWWLNIYIYRETTQLQYHSFSTSFWILLWIIINSAVYLERSSRKTAINIRPWTWTVQLNVWTQCCFRYWKEICVRTSQYNNTRIWFAKREAAPGRARSGRRGAGAALRLRKPRTIKWLTRICLSHNSCSGF